MLAEDQVLRSLIARARREVGHERLRTLARAIALAESGPLLPEVDSAVAARLREELDALVGESRRELARLLLAAGRPAEGAAAARAAVVAEPYREDGWRVLMRAEASAAGPAAAEAAFAECGRALAEIDLEPSPETIALAGRLRRPRTRRVTARR